MAFWCHFICHDFYHHSDSPMQPSLSLRIVGFHYCCNFMTVISCMLCNSQRNIQYKNDHKYFLVSVQLHFRVPLIIGTTKKNTPWIFRKLLPLILMKIYFLISFLSLHIEEWWHLFFAGTQ